MIGSRRIRRPVAWNTALAIAGATPTTASSPMPYEPRGLISVSDSSMNVMSMRGASAWVGIRYSARPGGRIRAETGSVADCSSRLGRSP